MALTEEQQQAITLLKNMFPSLKHDAILAKVAPYAVPDLNAIIETILSEPSTSTPRVWLPEHEPLQPPVKKAKVERLVPAEIAVRLTEVLPTIDPDYLAKKAHELDGQPDQAVDDFILQALENINSLPQKVEPARKTPQKVNEGRQVSVEELLAKIPDPLTYFNDDTRPLSSQSREHALEFLKRKFPKHAVGVMRNILFKTNYVTACKQLSNLSPTNKTKRVAGELDKSSLEDSLLLEVCYVEHEEQIKQIAEENAQKRRSALQEGAIFNCQCCFDEFLLIDAFECESEHMFCKECVCRGAEVQIGDSKTEITCLEQCPAKFPLKVLEKVLSPIVFSNYLQKLQLEEIKSACIDGLESCPECSFCSIVANQEDRVFYCLNPICLRETCRLCKEKAHIPFKCEEVEKDEEAKARTTVEEKLTQALLRNCWNCQTPFFKEEGCNKMTCPKCSKKMCYICRSKVQDYNHFYGQGSEPIKGRCPLYTDVQSLHAVEVKKAAEEAMREAKITMNLDLAQPRQGFNVAENFVPTVRNNNNNNIHARR